MVRSTNLCFLCQKRAGKEESLHRIPKNPDIRNAWIAFCKLDENVDDISKVLICSKHFLRTDYIEPRARELGNNLILKRRVIPSVLKPHVGFNLTSSSKQDVDMNLQHTSPSDLVFSEEAGCSSREVTSDKGTPKKRKLSREIMPEETEMQSHNLQHESRLNPETSHGQFLETPKKARYCEPRFVGDIKTPHLSTPRSAKRCLNLAKSTISQQKLKIRNLQQKNRNLIKRVKHLDALVEHLKKKNLISESSADTMVATLPASIKEIISRKLGKRDKSYFPEIRKFALTLQFYSSAAYNYVRKTWRNLLPHPSTLRQWYSVVDGKPGFTKEALSAIAARNKISQVNLNIVIDEMSIRSQTIYSNGRFYGGVDMGSGIIQKNDNMTMASNALVFMAVSLNGHWKVPLGYFLIDGLNGSERANLLKNCLQLIKDTGANVFSLTFDGAPVNLAMCTSLGANFNYHQNTFKPWFINPVTGDKIWTFWDPCHMIKLIRNTLGDKKVLTDISGNKIKWEHIEILQKLQGNEGLHMATKLTRKHIHFQDNRMQVKLATQTLSESVYNTFRFVDQLKIPKFEGCMPTAEYCYIFNNIFDVLNCKNRFSKKNKFNVPINETNVEFLREQAKHFEKYISDLRDTNGTPILESQRKTGFLGLIICLRNIFELYEKLKDVGQTYLLTFKLSQDYLETFFSCIRGRGGFNNNPNARQFESAYKRLLIRHEISNTYTSNCLADGVEILHVSSKRIKITDPVIDYDDINWDFSDHDYISTLWSLTPYLENVIKYIAGFIVKKILSKKSLCVICAKQLTVDHDDSSLLINLKNRGSLIFSSSEVCKICFVAERILRQNYHILFSKENIKDIFILNIFRNIYKPFDNEIMNNHILSNDFLDNHQSQLTKLIIESFLNIRLFHEAKIKSQKDENIRQKYTKLILFKNQ